MADSVLERRILRPQPRARVFAFFADAGNLEALTPPWLSFRILSPRPIAMAAGTCIDYRIRLRGLALRWRSRIASWDPPERFVDEQVRGPYRRWVHEHRFIERPDGTEVIDLVRYSVLGGRMVDRLFVRRDLERIFEFRERRLRELLGASGDVG